MTSPNLNPVQRDAFRYMESQLRAWGLDSLIGDLRNLIVKGETNTDTLTLALSNTKAYKIRFAGNEERIKNGLAALSPAQYLSMEASYRDVLQAYGLPKGFYDQHSDFADFIGKDISASELDQRAKIAHDQYENAPAYMKQLWGQYYGTKGDAIAAILDPDVATQRIVDRANTVAIGGSAAKYGINIGYADAARLDRAGITGSDADKAYQQIAQSQSLDQGIAQRFGQNVNLRQEEDARLLGNAQDTQKLNQLYGEEAALFKGRMGVTGQSLGVSQDY